MNTQRIAGIRGAMIALALFLLAAPAAYPHAGHDKAPGEEDTQTTGPVYISHEAGINLGIATETADLRSIETTLMVIGNIEAIPGMSATVSSRISGRVAELMVLENEAVRKGQPLVTVESRMLGDPPPHVDYTSPIDGLVLDRHVVPGDTVEPDAHLLMIADLTAVYAEGRVFEGQISSVRTGQKVRVRVDAYPDESFEGVIDRTGAALDPETRTLKIWVRIDNPGLKLRPNMRARLYVVTAASADSVAVPRSAVLGDMGNLFVFVQTDASGLEYEKRPVVTGISDDRYMEIVDGVLPGDEVVTEGNYQLQYVTSRKPAGEAPPDQPKSP
jgi:multidrug efflux pump subunit AcrA (membrane-fusion protein)